MTKVLLIYPTPSMASPQKSPPLSILHVGEALRLTGKYEIQYYDERYETSGPNINWADVVGVSSMTGYQLKGAIRWLKAAKQAGKKTVLGGIHVTMQPEQCLAEDYVDAVVTGPGEKAIELAIEGPVKQIYAQPLRSGDHVSPVTPNTAIHFVRSSQTGDTILLSSRGCPQRCGFCYTQQFFGRQWQSVDLDRWRQDVVYLRNRIGVRKLEHGDDWIGPWPRARENISFLRENGIAYRPSIRANQIEESVAKEMAELGVKHVSIGMETASPRMLKLIQKDITVEQQFEAAAALAKYGIWPLYYWIAQMPTETPEELNQTLAAMDRMYAIHKGKLTQNIYCYLPLPGTPLWDLANKTHLPTTMEDWSEYSLNQTDSPLANALYHIGGLHFHRGKNDKTDRNFPGVKRLAIAPFELSAAIRWKFRFFKHYGFEKKAVEKLLAWASRKERVQ